MTIPEEHADTPLLASNQRNAISQSMVGREQHQRPGQGRATRLPRCGPAAALLTLALAGGLAGCDMGATAPTTPTGTPNTAKCQETPNTSSASTGFGTSGEQTVYLVQACPPAGAEVTVENATNFSQLNTTQREQLWLNPSLNQALFNETFSPADQDLSDISKAATPEVTYNTTYNIPTYGLTGILLSETPQTDGSLALVLGGTYTDAQQVTHRYVIDVDSMQLINLTGLDFWTGGGFGANADFQQRDVAESSQVEALFNSAIGKNVTIGVPNFKNKPAPQAGIPQSDTDMALGQYAAAQWITDILNGKTPNTPPSFIGVGTLPQANTGLAVRFFTLPNGAQVQQ